LLTANEVISGTWNTKKKVQDDGATDERGIYVDSGTITIVKPGRLFVLPLPLSQKPNPQQVCSQESVKQSEAQSQQLQHFSYNFSTPWPKIYDRKMRDCPQRGQQQFVGLKIGRIEECV